MLVISNRPLASRLRIAPAEQHETDYVRLRSLRLHCLCGLMDRWHKIEQFQQLFRWNNFNPRTFVWLGICQGHNFLAARHFPSEIQLHFDTRRCVKKTVLRGIFYATSVLPSKNSFPVRETHLWIFTVLNTSVDFFRFAFLISQSRHNKLQKHLLLHRQFNFLWLVRVR